MGAPPAPESGILKRPLAHQLGEPWIFRIRTASMRSCRRGHLRCPLPVLLQRSDGRLAEDQSYEVAVLLRDPREAVNRAATMASQARMPVRRPTMTAGAVDRPSSRHRKHG